MTQHIGETEFAFVSEGERPLECRYVIDGMLLLERSGEWDCGITGIELDAKVGVEEVVLNAEECHMIANYFSRHRTKLWKLCAREGKEFRHISDTIMLFRRSDRAIPVQELPVELLDAA